MKAILVLILAAAIGTVCAEPRKTVTRCPACKGERSLSLTPPNLGQHDGEIGVTPGKPFANHRWDVRHDRCPLCGGSGRQEAWVLKAKPPQDREGKEPCTTCWWSGVEPCRKCEHTGYIACPGCKNSRRGSKPGWIVEEQSTPGRTSRHKKIVVTACSTCGGVGKTRCPTCDGMGGQPCRRCKGEGYTQKKVK